MIPLTLRRLFAPPMVVVVLLATWTGMTQAYEQFSQDGGDPTNCAACHGDFRSNSYISLTDGTDWGNLHNLHRSTMLGGDCDACHGPGGTFPVLISSSQGGDGLEPLSCMGCHGRSQDNTESNPDWPHGYGAGLRQHHNTAGVLVCLGCHQDADPANFSSVGEGALPSYYANPGNNHPNMPTSSCNQDGSEDFAGIAEGLDNDGDNVYDGDDENCINISTPEEIVPFVALGQNYPNPFNPETTIRYSLAQPGWARVEVYTVTGELVRTLVAGFHEKATTYTVSWDGQDSAGNGVASGMYFCRLEAGEYVETRRMTLVR